MMTHDQIIDLLSLAAARDRRTIGKADVLAWHADIGDLTFDDCREAIGVHFRGSTEWLLPAHVRRIVKRIREERIGPAGPGLGPTPPRADPDDPKAYLAALRAQQTAVGDGREPPAALPAGDGVPDDDNPHVRAIRERFEAEQAAGRRREAEQREAEREALAAYRAAVEWLLGLPDHGATAVREAREELLGDDEAAAGFPMLAEATGVTDEHKITIWAALNTGLHKVRAEP